MERIQDIEAFLAIVERGNLSAAARHLHRSLQSISRSLASLELDIGVELITRTTHLAHPTDAGLEFYRRTKPALSEILSAKDDARANAVEPSGTIRIGAPVQLGPDHLVPALARFMEQYQKVDVELELEDRFVDIVGEGLDLAVRIGETPASDLKAKRLGMARRVVIGAPSYFAKHGRPDHPNDLVRHHCVFRSTDTKAGVWRFRVNGKAHKVRVQGRLGIQNAATSHAAVAEGMGIGWAPLWQVQRLVESGRVEVILASFEEAPVPIQIVWPMSRFLPARTRLLIDHLAEHLLF